MAWKKGQRVYDRSGDFFGCVTEDEKDGKVMIKRDMPWDPKAEPVEVDVDKVEGEAKVRAYYNM